MYTIPCITLVADEITRATAVAMGWWNYKTRALATITMCLVTSVPQQRLFNDFHTKKCTGDASVVPLYFQYSPASNTAL